MTTLVSAQEIWFVPNSAAGGQSDFMELFQPDASWKAAASHVDVFGISSEFLAHGSDADITKVFADLRRRKIAFANAMLPLSGPPSPNTAQCGYHVEGYSSPGETAALARKVKSLGGVPRYYGMDSPLFFGHLYDGPNACHTAIKDIAGDAAAKVMQVQSVFPGVQVGDTEPFMTFATESGRKDLTEWLDAYEAATGQRLAFLGLDMDWRAPWQSVLPTLIDLLHRRGIRPVAIYNATGEARSDEEWIAEANAHFRAFEIALHHRVEAVSIQSWGIYPKRLLPETDPLTLTSLVNQYVAWKQRHN